MGKTRRNLLAFPLALICVPVFAQQEQAKLPNVLVIGDSIYQQHARGVTSELKGQANVQLATWPQNVLPNSTNAIEHIDQLLGFKDRAGNAVPEEKRPTWDLIHFNVGLGDLIFCVPNLKSHRVLPYTTGGVIRTNAKQYEANLNTLLRLLRQKAPGAQIVWASTTPIRHSRNNAFKLGTEVEYNQIAERVMKSNQVPINDMYTYAKGLIDMERPAGHGVDPFFFDRKPIHPPMVELFRRNLGLKPSP